MTHTPGPWTVNTFKIKGTDRVEVLDAKGDNACVQANAHLIAAAPELLGALKVALPLVESIYLDAEDETRKDPTKKQNSDYLFTQVEFIKNAIAKAEGRG